MGGKFPLNAVTIMRRICEEAETVVDYSSLYLSTRAGVLSKDKTVDSVESVCSSAVKACIDSGAPLILALTASETTARQLLCVRGVVPMLTASFVGTDSVIQKALNRAKAESMVKAGDCV